MISSHEEFCLLLNKWASESKELFVVMFYQEQISTSSRCLSVVVGKLAHLDDETLIIKDDKGNTAMVRYSGYEFTYESELRAWGVAQLTGRKFEDVFVLGSPTGMTVAVGSTSRVSPSD